LLRPPVLHPSMRACQAILMVKHFDKIGDSKKMVGHGVGGD
jgi:hypothetical protein